TRRYAYVPRPAEITAEIVADNKTDPDVHLLVTVTGIHRVKDDVPDHHSLEVKIRLENLTEKPILFDPSRVSATLETPDQTAVPFDPPAAFDLAAGQRRSLTLRLPLPVGIEPEDRAAAGLNLSVEMEIAGRKVRRSVDFQRRYNRPVRYRFHGGFLYHHYHPHSAHRHHKSHHRPHHRPPPRRGPPHKAK
ncbi:MAG: hypothetical protein R3236_03295, partial [Phycisphaeraceae bacterium]|nr:hypothetical protein [Phycisphaeraceae bacterium]